ncbi:MAG: hypothetical protein IPG45_23335 [Deltaproteobacteria bacterium]|nr:hypothetical protein [Deltaproteobacteria bacterium]
MQRRLLLFPLLLGSLFGCGSDPAGPDNPDTPDTGVVTPDSGEPPAPVCTRDPATLDARAACLGQEHCGCGTHCALGECVYDCTTDTECGAAERCDELGYCRDRADPTLSLPLPAQASRGLRVEPSELVLEGPDAPRAIILGAPYAPVGRLRLVAPAGLELACDGQNFTAECRFDGIPMGERQVIPVRLLASASAEPLSVRIYSDAGLDTVTVRAVQQGDRATAIRGEYEGYAVATHLGTLGAGVRPAPNGLRLPVTVRYFPVEGVLELHDRLGVLHPNGVLIGRLGNDSVRFPAFHLPVERAVAGAEPEVLVQAFTASVAITAAGATAINFQLDQRFLGVLPEQEAPLVRYQVTLAFERNLATDATPQAVPDDEALVGALDRARDPTAWASALNDLTPGPSALALRAASRGERHDVTVCGADDAERLTATRDGVAEILGGLDPEQTFTYSGTGALLLTGNALERALSIPILPSWFLLNQLDPNTTASATIRLENNVAEEVAVDELPCAVRLPARTYRTFSDLAFCQADGPPDVVAASEVVDGCASFAAAYDCEVAPPTPTSLGTAPRLRLSHSMNFDQPTTGCLFETRPIFGFAEVVSVCRLRHPVSTCTEAVLCEGDGDPATLSSGLIDQRSRITGDLTCVDGTTPPMLELEDSADLGAATLLKTCVTDLDRLAEDPALVDLPTLLSGGGCVGPRLILALDFALERARRRALDGASLPPNALDALAHRLVQRWLEVHQLLAQESLEAENLASIIRRVDPSDDAVPPSIDRTLAKSRRGLGLLFHPRWAMALAALPEEILASPDYRRFYEATPLAPNPNHEQPVGLSVGLTEVNTAQLALAELRLRRARFAPDPRAVADSGALVREVILAQALGVALEAQARQYAAAQGERLTWDSRADAARGTFGRGLVGVLNEVDQLTLGRNPLGIEEEDLPLYFLGDEVSPGQRFSAISDYLLGNNPGATMAWAPAAVSRARTSLVAARTAWNEFKGRQLQREMAQGELDRNLDRLRFEFGDRVADYCSAPDTLGTAGILEEWEQHHGRPFSASNCYMRLDTQGCQFDLAKYATLLRGADLGYQLCVARRVQERTRTRIDFTEPTWSQAMNCEDAGVQVGVACFDGVVACARCTRGPIQIPLDLRQAPSQLAAVTRVAIAPTLLSDIKRGCAAQFANASVTLPSLSQVASVDYEQGRCFRGQLGEQALTIRAASKDLEIARAELGEHQESYGLAMSSCFLLEQGNTERQDAQAEHDRTMQGLNIAKAAVDAASLVAGQVKDCADAASDDLTLGVSTGISCGIGAIKLAADVASVALQTSMDEVERSHEAAMMKLDDRIAEDICFKDAEQFLVGTRADTLRVQRALQVLELALYQFNEMQIAADTYFADGQAALAVVRDRTIIPPTHDYWLSEAVTTFTRDYEQAQRLTYLAVRAVEYEYQQTLDLRAQVLSAEVPEDLQAVLQELNATAGTRSVGGRPTELQEVFSLRRDLFQLPDGARAHPSHRDPFRTRLMEPRYAVYDEDQNYLGQSIPFNVRPELLGANDCAERLWSISVNLVGSANAIVGLAPTVRVEVQKKNTFYSRWCSDTNRTEALQLASVRPTKNLLGGAELGLDRSIDDFTAARVTAWANVPAADFFDSRYANGSTSELAARGLFGDYTLFIPKESISAFAQGSRDGVVLTELDDVLIRFDYVSVAKP